MQTAAEATSRWLQVSRPLRVQMGPSEPVRKGKTHVPPAFSRLHVCFLTLSRMQSGRLGGSPPCSIVSAGPRTPPTRPFCGGAREEAAPTLARLPETLASAAGDEDDERSPVPPRADEETAVSTGAVPLQADAGPAAFRPRHGAVHSHRPLVPGPSPPASPRPRLRLWAGPGGKACV